MKSSLIVYSLIVSFVLVAYRSQSQVMRKFYYDENWQLSKKDGTALYFRESSFDTIQLVYDGTFKDFTTTGKIVMTGAYKSGIKEGEFVSYFNNGKVESVGNFTGNARSGVWKFFYENGVARTEVEFREEPRIIFFNDSTGNRLLENGNGKWHEEFYEFLFPYLISIDGFYKDGLRSGEWVCKSEGKLVYSEKFEQGKFLSGVRYDVNKPYAEEWKNKFLLPYKFAATEGMKVRKNVYRDDYPFISSLKSLEDQVYVVVESQPEFPGGYEKLNDFIQKNLHYKMSGTTTKVFVDFVINQDGKISDVRVTRGVNPELNTEAMRVVSMFPNWKPGMQNHKTVKVRFVLPITFR